MLAALADRPKPALFCSCVFCTAFLLLSFAGQKSWRFIFFATPFLYVIWGVALARSAQVLRRWTVGVTDRALAVVAAGLPRRPARWGLIAAGLVFLAVSSGAFARTLLMPLGIRLNEAPNADWAAAAVRLEPWLEEASVVLTTDELRTLYYLGRYDVAVSKERLYEIKRTPDGLAFEVNGGTGFTLDPRTGRPVIGTTAGLERILDRFPDGLLLADAIKGWRAPTVLDEAMADVVAARATPIDLPTGLRIKAFRWDHRSSDRAVPAGCGAVTALVNGRPPPTTARREAR